MHIIWINITLKNKIFHITFYITLKIITNKNKMKHIWIILIIVCIYDYIYVYNIIEY